MGTESEIGDLGQSLLNVLAELRAVLKTAAAAMQKHEMVNAANSIWGQERKRVIGYSSSNDN